MGMKYAEEPFNMGMYFFLPKASFKMGTFSDPQHTHSGIVILESLPPPLPTHTQISRALVTQGSRKEFFKGGSFKWDSSKTESENLKLSQRSVQLEPFFLFLKYPFKTPPPLEKFPPLYVSMPQKPTAYIPLRCKTICIGSLR